MDRKDSKRRSFSAMMSHPDIARRTALQAGAVGMLGLGSNHLQGLLGAEPVEGAPKKTAKSVIYIFLSGGLAQHESFDLKPDAPEEIRDVVMEMVERIEGKWENQKDDELLQSRFWRIFPTDATASYNGRPMHGEIKGRFGAHFLRNNPGWLK